MKEISKLFSAPMVLALLAGTKTQTRRTNGLKEINDQPEAWVHLGTTTSGDHIFERIAQPGSIKIIKATCNKGDSIWGKETHRFLSYDVAGVHTEYAADGKILTCQMNEPPSPDKMNVWRNGRRIWIPSIYMPRCVSRLLLPVTAEERIERVQEINEEDAKAEGALFVEPDGIHHFGWRYDYQSPVAQRCTEAYAYLWDSINGSGSWGRNLWVRVYTFGKIKDSQ